MPIGRACNHPVWDSGFIQMIPFLDNRKTLGEGCEYKETVPEIGMYAQKIYGSK